MIDDLKKVYKRLESAYPINAKDLQDLKQKKDDLVNALFNIDKQENQLEKIATELRDKHSLNTHLMKCVEEMAELTVEISKYVATKDPEKMEKLAIKIDKERADVLNTLTTFKGFKTMTVDEEFEYRRKQMKKHL